MTPRFELAADLALRCAVADEQEVDDVIVDALAELAAEAGAVRTYVTLYHDDGTFENSHEWTADGVVPHRPLIRRWRSSAFPYSFAMAQRDEVLAVTDLAALPEAAAPEKASFSSFGVHSLLQVPIVVSGDTVGVIGVNHADTVETWPQPLVELAHRIGQVIGVALLRKRAHTAAQRAQEQSLRADRERTELLALVSREVREPLGAILHHAERLALEIESQRGRTDVDQIEHHSRHLLSMLDDLMTISSGADEDCEVLLQPVVDAAISALRGAANARGIVLAVGADSGSAVVVAEPGRTRQVVYCLLSGAVQTVGSGGTITVDVVGDADGAPAVRVRLDGERRQPIDEVVTPLARMIIEGHGHIEVAAGDRNRLDVDVRFSPSS